MKIETDKPIIDVCCGSKMMWFDKNNPNVVFCDIRSESHTLCDGRALVIAPDVIADFTNLPFPDESFYLVSFDPPHFKSLGVNSWMAKKYGRLLPSWETDIKGGFDEAMRVLKKNGTLVLKWNVSEISMKELLNVLQIAPEFGHTTGRQSKTIWLTFFKY